MDQGTVERQIALAQALRDYGDPRYGGSLPLGGKASAGPRNGKYRSSYPSSMHPAEQSSYDSFMNLMEAELEDLSRRPGAMPGIQRAFDPAR